MPTLSSLALSSIPWLDSTVKFLHLRSRAFLSLHPPEFIRTFSWANLVWGLGAATGFLILSVFVFHRGANRDKGGSAIQI